MIDVARKEIGGKLIRSAFGLSLEDDVVYSYLCSQLEDDHLETEIERMVLFYMKKYKSEYGSRPTFDSFMSYVEAKLASNIDGYERFTDYMDLLETKELSDENKRVIFSSLDEHIKIRNIYNLCVTFKSGAQSNGLLDATNNLHSGLTNILFKGGIKHSNVSLIEGLEGTLESLSDRAEQDDRIPTGIYDYDNYEYDTGGKRGGLKRGTSFLCLGRSGTGKSTFLRSLCYHACIHGHDVIHIQAEGSDLDMKLAYMSMFSGIPLSHLHTGKFEPDKVKGMIDNRLSILKKKMEVKNIGRIYTYSFENFKKPSIHECKSFIENIYNMSRENPLSLIVVDYLDMFMDKYEDNKVQRKMKAAEEFTRIAIDYNVVFATATQSTSVTSDFINGTGGKGEPGVLEASHISIDKHAINPFSYVVSINQSDEENRHGYIRMWEIKERHGKISNYPLHSINMHRTYGHFINNEFTNVKVDKGASLL